MLTTLDFRPSLTELPAPRALLRALAHELARGEPVPFRRVVTTLAASGASEDELQDLTDAYAAGDNPN